KRLMPFHYWATRALPLYAEIAMQNPWMVAAYIRAIEGMRAQQERGETPAWLDNMTEFFYSPAGYTAVMNPLSALGMVSLFSDLARSQGADDETFAGALLRLAGDYGGVNLYPWFTSILNASGVMGDTTRGLDPT